MVVAATAFTSLLVGCRSGQPRNGDPPPDARRPVLKTETELAEERQARIESGEQVPTDPPVIEAGDGESTSSPPPPAAQPLRAKPGSIEADILLVDDMVLSVAEVLYPLRQELADLRERHTPAVFADQVVRLVRSQTQRDIQTLLVYAEALAELEEGQRERLQAAIDKEFEEWITHEFGGSTARMTQHLARYGLTPEQWRNKLGRELVVQQYTREKLMPQVVVPRRELLEYYERNLDQYTTDAARELIIIEFPFEKFLPEGVSWYSATKAQQGVAKLKAMRLAREAHEALAEQSCADVARAYSRGLHAEAGGSWGMIGKPLKRAPYDVLSARIFEMESGAYTEPIETETGWYIVQCGEVQPARQEPFVDVQEQIRDQLMERRFAKLSAEYVLRLLDEATIHGLNAFLNAAVETALDPTRGTAASR